MNEAQSSPVDLLYKVMNEAQSSPVDLLYKDMKHRVVQLTYFTKT